MPPMQITDVFADLFQESGLRTAGFCEAMFSLSAAIVAKTSIGFGLAKLQRARWASNVLPFLIGVQVQLSAAA